VPRYGQVLLVLDIHAAILLQESLLVHVFVDWPYCYAKIGYVFVLTVDGCVYYGEAMNTPEREPAPTIRAEVARRRSSVGRLAAATEMTPPKFQRRLSDPDTFRLGEIARIATALDMEPATLLAGWFAEIDR